MPLYQPTNITPSSFAGGGNGTVDVTRDIPVSWQVNGNVPMVAYQVVVMRNDAASAVVHDTGRVALAEPFYGTDYQGRVRYFRVELPAPAGMVNGEEKGYKLKISQWWSETEKVVQSAAVCFITRDAPELVMGELPDPLEAKSLTLRCAYRQKQGDALDYFRWIISELGCYEEADYLKDTGNITGTADIRVDYDGFQNGTDYMARCMVRTENGVEADTGWQSFSVAYPVGGASAFLTACQVRGKSALQVSWPRLVHIPGTAAGDWTLEDGWLRLPGGSAVRWDRVNGGAMALPAGLSVFWYGQSAGAELVPFRLTGLDGEGGVRVVQLKFTGGEVLLTLDGNVVWRAAAELSPADTWTAALTGGRLALRRVIPANGLYPDDGLFPADDLYPMESVGQQVQFLEGAADLPPLRVTAVEMAGAQRCDYLWLTEDPEGRWLETVMGQLQYNPEYGTDTWFLAPFLDGLGAGNLAGDAAEVTGVALYREEVGGNRLRRLGELPLSRTSVLDYGAGSQRGYRYYLFPLGGDRYVTAPLVTRPVTPLFWDWTLLECEADEADPMQFHAVREYAFGLNLTTGAVSNNATPNLLQNFTRYPARQVSAANYRSGSLQAYIGAVDQRENRYWEAEGRAEELLALSTSPRPKFLKSRRGELLRVETGGPVSLQVGDRFWEQPYTVTLPWVEVDSAEGVSILE